MTLELIQDRRSIMRNDLRAHWVPGKVDLVIRTVANKVTKWSIHDGYRGDVAVNFQKIWKSYVCFDTVAFLIDMVIDA